MPWARNLASWILRGFGGEALDERVADAAAFLLRLGDAGERRQKLVLGLHDVQVGFEVAR